MFVSHLKNIFATLSLIFALSVCLTSQTFAQSDAPAVNGGAQAEFENGVCLTDEKRRLIQADLQINIKKLREEGKIDAPLAFAPNMFIFPVRANATAATDFGVHGISNFVDQNLAFPGQVRDYNCGARTYDNTSGYNHKGVDIFTNPFTWTKMDRNEVAVIAAADGTIIFKSNGNFDRNCSFNNSNWNAVYLRHDDGTVSWYGHLKNNSLTAKAVGERVAQGEFLGIVGSSGNSTGPHLHFEIYNSLNQLQDPYQGACNTLNNFSYWLEQPAYRDSKINKLITHSAPPTFSQCSNVPEGVNEKNVFAPGSQLIVAAYYRDQMLGQQTQHSLIRPDGSTYQTWSHTSPSTYNASYWYFTQTLPVNVPRGAWRFRSVYQGQTYEKTFFIGQTGFDFDADGKADVSVFRPENGTWYINRSTGGFAAEQFGIATDRLVPADYDGDGRTDIAVYRDGYWYLQRSAAGFAAVHFGATGDVPVPGDYDGDGRADVAVFRPSNGVWYYQRSTAGFGAVHFGVSTDRVVPADYDGDGRTDPAVFRDGIWYLLGSSQGFAGIQFGIAGDKPVQADYDGDGKSDIAVFRGGFWYALRSSQGFSAAQFGIASDVPAPADYDGDGKADLSVYRDGNWYLQRSTAGFTGIGFGLTTDKPVPSAFLP